MPRRNSLPKASRQQLKRSRQTLLLLLALGVSLAAIRVDPVHVASIQPRQIERSKPAILTSNVYDFNQLLNSLKFSSVNQQIPVSEQEMLLETFATTQQGIYDAHILAAAEENSIDPFLLKGLLTVESGLNHKRRGRRIYENINGNTVLVSGGALGIAQFTRVGIKAVNRLRQRNARLMGDAYYERFTERDAMRAEEAIHAAAELLSWLIDRYGRDGGVTAYNSGVIPAKLVQKLGFCRARRSRLMRQNRNFIQLQGYRFLPNVLRQTNRYRASAGLSAV